MLVHMSLDLTDGISVEKGQRIAKLIALLNLSAIGFSFDKAKRTQQGNLLQIALLCFLDLFIYK